MSSVVLERECRICACASFTSAPAIYILVQHSRGDPGLVDFRKIGKRTPSVTDLLEDMKWVSSHDVAFEK